MCVCERERERDHQLNRAINRALNRALNDVIENFLIYIKGVSRLVSKYINKIK